MVTEIYRSEAGRTTVLQHYRQLLAQWPVQSREYSIDTEYGSTFVIESGDRANPPLLLLHGSVSNSLSWMGDIEALSSTHCVFAIDLIGEAGFSDANRPPYESGAYAEWLDELTTALGYSSVALAGMSLGGWMALEFANRHPDRVTQLCLLCPGGIVRENPSFVFKALFYMGLGAWGERRITRLVNGGKMPETEGMEEAMAFLSLIGRNFRPRTARLPLFDDASLRKLNMPILVIFGENDALIPPEQSIARLRALAENVTSDLLTDTGHALSGQGTRLREFLTDPPPAKQICQK